MPSINRIRVNNVKYNFGTQAYDDFVLRMYGKNTLYDLANGGGKSVLMLLLMQCMIPNSTLDEKQPIEKLFRDHVNTVIHSLVEWKLDPSDVKDGFRYMLTGFAAKQASSSSTNVNADEETEGENADADSGNGTASIEYFNYCIFYRNYNKNDIVNLPLIKGKERISYRGLRNYLSDLARKDKNLQVFIFDRKGQYQKFIADYGLHESQWEIIRGINKTEGHVRTYFETNFRTTRRVVEDLLIEGIIEKAEKARAEGRGQTAENTADLLMTIQGQLKELAEKKKGIRVFDHEDELLQLLIDRLQSFMGLFEEQKKTAKGFADIHATLQKFSAEQESHHESLANELRQAEERASAFAKQIDLIKYQIEQDKVRQKSEELSRLKLSLKNALAKEEHLRIENQKAEAAAEFFRLLEDSQKLARLAAKAELRKENPDKAKENLDAIVYNLKLRMEEEKQKLAEQEEQYRTSLASLKEKVEKTADLEREINSESNLLRGRLEVTENQEKEENSLLSEMEKELSFQQFGRASDLLQEKQSICTGLTEEAELSADKQEELSSLLAGLKVQIQDAKAVSREKTEALAELEGKLADIRQAAKRLKDLREIYCEQESDDLETSLAEKIEADLHLSFLAEERSKELEKMAARFADNLPLVASKSAEEVMHYLSTRHQAELIFGTDLLHSLPKAKQEKLLNQIPGLPYAVVVRNLNQLSTDPALETLDLDSEVLLYDWDSLADIEEVPEAYHVVVRTKEEDFLSGALLSRKKKKLEQETEAIREEIRTRQDQLESEREDIRFVREHKDAIYTDLNATLSRMKSEAREASALVERLSKEETKASEKMVALQLAATARENQLAILKKDIQVLTQMAASEKKLSLLASSKEEMKRHLKELDAKTLEVSETLESAVEERDSARDRLQLLAQEIRMQDLSWKEKYAPYDSGRSFGKMDDATEVLEEAFQAAVSGGLAARDEEQERLLRETLQKNMNRGQQRLKRLHTSFEELKAQYDEKTLLAQSDEEMDRLSQELSQQERETDALRQSFQKLERETSRELGSLEYLEKQLVEKYGESSFAEVRQVLDPEKALGEASQQAKETKTLVDELSNRLAEDERNNRSAEDTLKIAEHVIKQNALSLSDGEVLDLDPQKCKDEFDQLLLVYDRTSKNLERAKSDTLKVRSMVVESLYDLGVAELGASIRDEADVPGNLEEAEDLISRLSKMQDLIRLEKDRVEKTLTGMEELKDRFVDQCVERCLSVRTALGLLPGLSEITMDGKKIQMLQLSIPYVKDTFMKERMSSYIDGVVAEVDTKKNEAERQKFLHASLSMKKLFSVIVTDMSRITLKLYKRERIAEQSRYLKYEEAVGSTGQSQGIYIQFLISVINYISGMYAPADDKARMKTIFIDNPFGAAKDIYIWEPIFQLLAENHVQLVVPTRGATPEITGRFDINYILGQQKIGAEAVTVVVNYSSRTEDKEMEYKDLEYEQATFDFI